MDVGIAGTPLMTGDVPRGAIAAIAGKSLEEIAALPRGEALEVVAAAARPVVHEMMEAGQLEGALGLGGGTGTWLCNAILADLPFGFPKVLVSTLPTHDATTDIVIVPSVADIAGLNRVLKPILANAAAAICGMVGQSANVDSGTRRTAALSMFGVTTRGATFVREFLEAAGWEVVVFHANGTGGRTMEALAGRGMFDVVVDWTLSEITDEIAGGVCTAGLHRLEAAGHRGIPQIVVPGAVDVINFYDAVPERLRGRPFHMHLPHVPLVRASAEESRIVGEVVARKLNQAKGPVRVIVPMGGFSALDKPGGLFEDRAADEAFIDGLRSLLRLAIPVDVREDHINSERFARAVADAAIAIAAAQGAG
jgi:uncharacterized protein (UPF0261 family)